MNIFILILIQYAEKKIIKLKTIDWLIDILRSIQFWKFLYFFLLISIIMIKKIMLIKNFINLIFQNNIIIYTFTYKLIVLITLSKPNHFIAYFENFLINFLLV